MSESVWTNFAARIPNTWTSHDLVALVEDATWDGDTLVDVSDGVTLIERNAFANYGLVAFDDVFDWLHLRQVPYIANDEPIPGCAGEIRVCDGFIVVSGQYDGEQPVLCASLYDTIVAGDDADFAGPDDYFAKLSVRISELSIDHLPAFPPPDPGAIATPCNDCGEPCAWDDEVHDYRHIRRRQPCFLIRSETLWGET